MSLPKRTLTLFDSVCLIVGIIVGVGIFQVAPDVAKGTTSPEGLLALWLLGGFMSLCGALCYAELASSFPQVGGDYVYLTKSYGKWAGFIFGWIQLIVTRPGDIAVMAFAFATYARAIWDPFRGAGSESVVTLKLFACTAVIVFTVVNIVGARSGKRVQNTLTVLKLCGILAVVGVALLVTGRGTPVTAASLHLPVGLALILILYSYGGWTEIGYVASEVKNPQKNFVRSMTFGVLSVAVVYLVLNVAYMAALGFGGLTQATAVAAEVVERVFPDVGKQLVSALICLSALGNINGLIFTGARISYAVGMDHRVFSPVGKWSEKTETPVRALILQGALAVTLILALGSFIDAVVYYAPVVYSFYLGTTLSVMVLRKKFPGIARPYRVSLYPIPMLVFAATCLYLIYSAIAYKPALSLLSFGLALLGLPLYWISSRKPMPVSQVKGPGSHI